MPLYAWLALAVFIVAPVGGGVHAAVSGLRAWRELRALQRKLGRSLLEVTTRVAAVEGRLARAGEQAARLDRARARLQHSLATLTVMRAAAGDASAALRLLALLRR